MIFSDKNFMLSGFFPQGFLYSCLQPEYDKGKFSISFLLGCARNFPFSIQMNILYQDWLPRKLWNYMCRWVPMHNWWITQSLYLFLLCLCLFEMISISFSIPNDNLFLWLSRSLSRAVRLLHQFPVHISNTKSLLADTFDMALAAEDDTSHKDFLMIRLIFKQSDLKCCTKLFNNG